MRRFLSNRCSDRCYRSKTPCSCLCVVLFWVFFGDEIREKEFVKCLPMIAEDYIQQFKRFFPVLGPESQAIFAWCKWKQH